MLITRALTSSPAFARSRQCAAAWRVGAVVTLVLDLTYPLFDPRGVYLASPDDVAGLPAPTEELDLS